MARLASIGVRAVVAVSLALLASTARAERPADPSAERAPSRSADASGPDPGGGMADLARSVPRAIGDVVGGVALVSAATIATVGDGVRLLDANRVSRPLTRGALSQTIRGAAWLISWGGTEALERLRSEPVERWPEPSAAYLEADPGLGRIDTAASGLGALFLAPRDLFGGIAQGLLRTAGAHSAADALRADARRAALETLGPPPGPILLAD